MAVENEGFLTFLAYVLAILFMISIPLSIILVCTTCIASFRTHRWKKQKRRRAALPQSDIAALPQDDEHASDSDSDDSILIDPDDPIERRERDREREEKAEDWHLTTGQKFRKEWKKAFSLYPGIDKKERSERSKQRQLVKVVAKEMIRMQRRNERRAARNERRAARNGGSSVGGNRIDEVELPTYQKATHDKEN